MVWVRAPANAWVREAEPLYEWLADFAAHKLIPGGSMFVFVRGRERLARSRDGDLQPRPKYCWKLEMQHQGSRHYPRLNVAGGVSVPEPSSLRLRGNGLLGMLVWRRHAATA